MSNIILPTERRKAISYNPRLLVLFGKPKTGKSSIVASLDSNLIIDLEDGYRALDAMVIQAKGAADIYNIRSAIEDKIRENGGKLPYRYITIDNASRLEEMSLAVAASKYRKTSMGAGWGYLKDKMGMVAKDKDGRPILDPNADVRTLPNGSGYLYTRLAIKEIINMFKPLCETLILVCHVKDKQITKDSQEQSEMTLDLAGKMGPIICGEADAIGYIYREGKKTYISFEGGDNTLREARCLHLRGKRFMVASSDEDNVLKVDMSQIFLDMTKTQNS